MHTFKICQKLENEINNILVNSFKQYNDCLHLDWRDDYEIEMHGINHNEFDDNIINEVDLKLENLLKENIGGEIVNKTIITQIIPTIQGEGPSVGLPVLLIRTGNCNLSCDFCDTKWTNNLNIKDLKLFNIETNYDLPFIVDDSNFDKFIEYINKEFLNQFKNINTILLSGGEPLINKEFIKKLIHNTKLETIFKIEIETNGTLFNNEDDYRGFDDPTKIIQLNISPKMNPKSYKSDDINNIKDIINLFNKNEKILHKILLNSPTTINWKFVYSEKDEASINLFIKETSMVNLVYIQPLTPDYIKYKTEMGFLEDFRVSCHNTLEYSIRNGYSFSSRTHVWVFNNYKQRNELLDVRNI